MIYHNIAASVHTH